MEDTGDNERPSKRAKTLEVDVIGSKGLVKKSEYIRIIIDALNSLGFNDIGTRLEQQSGIDLHVPAVARFLEQVKKGAWDESIATLQEHRLLRDHRFAQFLLLEQKLFDALMENNHGDAHHILRNEIVPLGVNMKQCHELTSKFVERGESGEHNDSHILLSRSKVMEKLQKMFPPGVIIPERRLECLLEKTLDDQLHSCTFHNILDSDLSLCSYHHCWKDKLPSVTVQILEEHTDEVWFLKFSHDGKYLASSSKDKSAIIWEINAEGKFVQKHKLEGHEKPVVAVLWSPDDQQVITCGDNENIRLWDVGTGGYVRSYEKDGVGSVSCAWFHDGSGIIGGMTDRRICLWNLDGTVREHVQDQRSQKLSDVAMTSDGKWLISTGRKANEILLFDMKTKVETVFEVDDVITSFSLSTDDEYILIDQITEEITIWNIQGNEPDKYFEYKGRKRGRFIIRSCFGGYKETFVASGSEDSQVYIWHISEACELSGHCRVLPGHAGSVNCVSWNPADPHMLASASDDRTIRIWGLDEKLND